MASFGYTGENEDYSDSLSSFEQLAKQGKPVFFDASIYERLIHHYCEEESWENAEIAVEWAVYFHPYSVEVRLAKVRYLTCQGDFPSSISLLEDCEVLQPLDPEVKMAKGNVYINFGKYQEAIECLQGLIDEADPNPQVMYVIGYAYQCMEEHTEAINYYKKALLIDHLCEDAAIELIHCTHLQEEIEQSIDFFKEQIDVNPYASTFWSYLGLAYNAKPDYYRAASAFEYATITDGTNGKAYEDWGHALMNVSLHKEASEAYAEALEINGESASLHCHLGASKEQQGLYKEAFRHYKTATQLDEQSDEGWYGMGICMMHSKNWMEAIQFLTKALKINRFSDEYWLQLAISEYELGNWNSCEEAFEQAVAMNGLNPEVWLHWSEAHYTYGNLKQAIEIILDALEDLPYHAELNYRACAYYLYSGDYEMAFHYLEMALHINYDMHIILFDFFSNLTMQKAIKRIITEITQSNSNSIL